jgi:phosphoserine aminotransferase
VKALPADQQAAFSKGIVDLVEKQGAGFDLGAYRDAPPGLRIWCGATVETADVAVLMQWVGWAYSEMKAALPKAA